MSVMRETNHKAGAAKPAGSARQIAENGAAQAKETYAKMNAATAEASGLVQISCAAAAKGAMEYNVKVVEIARANANAAFDYARDLNGVKSPSEFIEVMTEHARKSFDAFSAQTKELTALAQKVTSEAAEPLKAGVTKAFRGHLG
jgi:phasin